MISESKHKNKVTVRSFLESGQRSMELELIAGEKWLNRSIPEAAINRAGLGLAGFLKHFPQRRVQVIGLAEHSYLSSLSKDERKERLGRFFEKKVPCVVFSRHKRVFPCIKELADKYRVPVLRTSAITKHFVNAATILMENLMAPSVKHQGTMVEIMGIGVMIEGKPGLGKSEIALALIRKGYALVSDDITSLRLDSSGTILGTPIVVTRYHMEIRGLGIIHVPSLFGVAAVREQKRLDLVVRLYEPKKGVRKPSTDVSGSRSTCQILEQELPLVEIPVLPGRDLANVVETAALDQKLRVLGHDATKELDNNLMEIMSRTSDGSE